MVLPHSKWHKQMQSANRSDLSLRLKLAKLSADRVFTDSEFHTVGAATAKEQVVTELTTHGHWSRCAVDDRSILYGTDLLDQQTVDAPSINAF